MARRKIFKSSTPVEEEVNAVEEVVEEVVEKEESKNDEESQLVSLKEKICEFYWITDGELFSPERDLSKYNLSKQEEETLLEWACKNKKVKAGDIVFDIYTQNKEAWAIIVKYGLTPQDVAEGNLEELTDEEKDVITAHYNDLISKL